MKHDYPSPVSQLLTLGEAFPEANERGLPWACEPDFVPRRTSQFGRLRTLPFASTWTFKRWLRPKERTVTPRGRPTSGRSERSFANLSFQKAEYAVSAAPPAR
jgi:hypothetical protein